MDLSAIVEGFSYRNEGGLNSPDRAEELMTSMRRIEHQLASYLLSREQNLGMDVRHFPSRSNIAPFTRRSEVIPEESSNKDIIYSTINGGEEPSSTLLPGSIEREIICLPDNEKMELVKTLSMSRIRTNGHAICVICHREFRKRYDLLRHLCIHLDLRPYRCKICAKRFVQKGAAMVHMKTHVRQQVRSSMHNAWLTLDRSK